MQPKRVWGGLVLLALLDPDDLDELLDNGDIPDWYKDVIREQLEALRDGQDEVQCKQVHCGEPNRTLQGANDA